MRVNTVDFTAGSPARVSTVSLCQNKRMPVAKYDNKIKAADIIPISGLLGASLMSVYFIKKGNLDVGMRALRL